MVLLEEAIELTSSENSGLRPYGTIINVHVSAVVGSVMFFWNDGSLAGDLVGQVVPC